MKHNPKQILRTILSGDALKYVIKYRRFLIFSFVLAMLYISNGLMFSLSKSKASKLEDDLLRSKAKYNIRLEEMNKLCRYPNLIDLLKNNNRDLKISKRPIKIEK